MRLLRPRLTYANVVSTIALVLTMSGGAVYAAGQIGSKQIRKGAVHSRQIKNKQVRRQDIAGGAVNSRKVSNDTLKGKDIVESSLGLVPAAQDARSVNGVGVRMVRASQPNGSSVSQVLSEAGMIALLSCPGGVATMQVRGSALGDAGTVFDSDSGSVQQFSAVAAQTVATAGQVNPGIASVRRIDGTLTRLDFELLSIPDGYGTQHDCFLNGFVASGK